MSQARASSAPAPRAMPATAAMVGFVRCSRAQNASCPRVTHSWASFGASFAHSSMSIPEEKTRLPAPATTTARIESSFSSSGTRDIRSVTMERRIVFRGGFSIQRTATRPPFSMRRRGVEGIGPLADATEIIVAYGRRSTPFFYRATDTAPMRGTATLDKPWFARWPADLPRSLTYPDVPVQDLLRRTAGQHGERPAVRFYGKTLTYRDLDAAVDRFAAGLRAIGVRAGDRVSLLLPNTPHFMVAFFAVLRAGAIVVQTNPILTPRELEVLWNDAGLETGVALDLFWHNLVKTKPRTGIKRVVVCDAAEFLKTPLRQLYPITRRENLKKAVHWPLTIPRESWISRFADLARTPAGSTEASADPDDVAVLQYTGGTTGTPKGAMLTHRKDRKSTRL